MAVKLSFREIGKNVARALREQGTPNERRGIDFDLAAKAALTAYKARDPVPRNVALALQWALRAKRC